MSQHVHALHAGKEGDDSVRKLLSANLVQKLIEMPHCLGRVRGIGKKAGELLDHRNRHSQAFLLPPLLDLAPPAVCYEKLVGRLVAAAANSDLVNIDAPHGESI